MHYSFAPHFSLDSTSKLPTFITVLAMFVWVRTDVAGYSFEAFKAVAVAIPFYAIAALEGNKKKAKVIETKQTEAKPRL